MEAAAAALEADAPVDDIDIITAGVDELGENDQFAVLKALVRNADVEGVQRHLEVLDYNGATVSARSLGLAARLPLTVHYGDAAVHERSRAVMLLVVAACNEQTLGQCVVNTTHWTHEYAPGRRGSQFPPFVGGDAWQMSMMTYAVTVLHQFAWDGDTEALATVLALSECSARLVNATTRNKVNHAFTRTLEMKPGITPLHLALMAGQAPIVRLLLADGRADPNYLTNDGATPLVDSALGAVMWDGRLNHRIAEAVRVLTRDPRTNADVWYNKNGKSYTTGGGTQYHVLHKLARYGYLEIIYHVLAALPNLDPGTLRVIGNSQNVSAALGTYTTPIEICAAGPPLSCSYVTIQPTLWFLIEVSNDGGFKKWRAEKAREMMVIRALVSRARKRRRFDTAASLTHRLFNMRDDAIFLHVLSFCWFLDPRRHVASEWDIQRTRLRKEGKSKEEATEIIRATLQNYPGYGQNNN